MPAKSKAQREAIAIAEHEPNKLYERNKGILSMSKKQMHEYASTSESGLKKTAKTMAEMKKKAKQKRH